MADSPANPCHQHPRTLATLARIAETQKNRIFPLAREVYNLAEKGGVSGPCKSWVIGLVHQPEFLQILEILANLVTPCGSL
jgi:hypothetical protein